jgi:hypothetical protein
MKLCAQCQESPTLVRRKSMLWIIFTYQCPCGKSSIGAAFRHQCDEDQAQKSAAAAWDVIAGDSLQACK